MPIYMTARFQVRPESVEKCRQAIDEFVADVKRREPRTLLYTSLQERDNPTRFLHTFIFRDKAALDIHSNSDAVKRFTSVLYPETLAPVEFTEYVVVASTNE